MSKNFKWRHQSLPLYRHPQRLSSRWNWYYFKLRRNWNLSTSIPWKPWTTFQDFLANDSFTGAVVSCGWTNGFKHAV